MTLSENYFDLNRLPRDQLVELAEGLGLDLPAGAKKHDVVLALASIQNLEVADQASGYAGQTSVTWVRVREPVPPTRGERAPAGLPIDETATALQPIDPQSLDAAITSVVGTDPYGAVDDVRPADVTPDPQLVRAQRRDDGTRLLTFVYARRQMIVFHNFEMQSVYADDFFDVVVQPDTGVIEVRASADRVRRLCRTWLAKVSEAMNLEVAILGISRRDYEGLATELSATLDKYRGKAADGSIYDTRELTRSPTCDDLLQEEEFLAEIKDYDPLGVDLLFNYAGAGTVRISVSTRSNSIWFRRSVPEAVLRHVFEALNRVRLARTA